MAIEIVEVGASAVTVIVTSPVFTTVKLWTSAPLSVTVPVIVSVMVGVGAVTEEPPHAAAETRARARAAAMAIRRSMVAASTQIACRNVDAAAVDRPWRAARPASWIEEENPGTGTGTVRSASDTNQ